MSNFLKKGKRDSAKEFVKTSEKAIDVFNRTLLAMNHVYYELINDESLNEENIEEKIANASNFKFSQGQLDMLKQDLLSNEPPQ